MSEKSILLVVAPDEHYLQSVAEPAARRGLVDELRCVWTPTQENFDKAMGFIKGARRLIIAKGMIETKPFLQLLLRHKVDDKKVLLGPEGFLSHCFVMSKKPNWWTPRGRPVIIADCAVAIAPGPDDKAKIAKNAIDLARRLLHKKRPVVSFLTPQGKLNPDIKSSVDATAAIEILEAAGVDAEMRLDQADTAMTATARKIKGLPGGPADIMIVSGLDEGNTAFKIFTQEAGWDAAGLVCGSSVPVVLNSRADDPKSKILAIEYASRLLQR
ncbi:MAG: hypothetical protein LBL46_00900 [Rickettsiales bacterium]|jgi:hypothetical protein|nr:hypothetical protein [Rickettsiales bacterium]